MDERYWSAKELLLGVVEHPAKVRGTFPRFRVKADGKATTHKTLSSLNKEVSVIHARRPRVFVNAGKGITIDFDTRASLNKLIECGEEPL